MVETISGIKEGDLVVIKTVAQTAKTSSSSQSQGLFSVPGTGANNSVKNSSGGNFRPQN
jgi:hypothetical protein